MTDLDLCYATIADAGRLLKARKLSPVELTRAALDRLHATQDQTNAFIAVLEDEALAAAKTAERAIARGGYRGGLHGVPVSIKDIYDLKGHVTTCGSAVLQDNVAGEDAFSVARLKQAGAVIIGQGEHDRVRRRARQPRLRPGPQSLGPRAQRRPLEQRFGGQPRRRRRLRLAGHRHRRLDPAPGGLLRLCRHQADLWPGQPPRGLPAGLVARPRGATGADRPRRRGHPARHRRP